MKFSKSRKYVGKVAKVAAQPPTCNNWVQICISEKKMKIYHKKPKGFVNFTDLNSKKEMKKSGYSVRAGRNPYTSQGGKVLFYKRVRK